MDSISKASLRFSGTISRAVWIIFSTALLGLWGVPQALAVRPISALIAMVAGDESRAGYQDGSFTSALFNRPLGLAISGDGNSLFVADSGNNRIRVIHLDQDNEVTTLAGQNTYGKLDGPLTVAQFNDPRGVVYLPDDRLVVNDFGNRLLRLVDLKSETVTTLAGGSPKPQLSTNSAAIATPAPIPAAQAPMNGVQGMAYLPVADSVFYTQPDMGSLKRLDLKTGLVSTVLNQNTQIPNPAALWCQDDKIYVADRNLPVVYEIEWNHGAAPNLLPAGTPLDKVVSLSSNDHILYGLLAIPGIPAERFIVDNRYSHDYQPNNQIVTFRSPWGDTVPPEQYFQVGVSSLTPWTGFAPDPSDGRKFYVSKPEYNMVIYFRDLFSSRSINSAGFSEPEFPAQKPKNTYRMIIAGSSRSMEVHDYPFKTDYHPQSLPPDSPVYPGYPHNVSLCPQVERELNFQTALDGIPWNFEVLNFGRQGTLLFWPTFLVPDVVKRVDADLVIIFQPIGDFAPYSYYFEQPLSADGIPKFPIDTEYILKPPLERIQAGLPRKFYDFCKAHGWVKIEGRNIHFDDYQINNSADPELHDMILEFYGKPLDALQRKLSNMRTPGGKPVRLLMLLTYTGRQWDQHHDNYLWIEAAKKFNIPYLNMEPDMNALHLSFIPYSSDGNHFDPDGCIFYGRLLARELVRNKLIPWEEDSQGPKGGKEAGISP